jgi:uncharacterized protein YbjQ (UPF0145 family)
MHCSTCDALIPDDALFCIICGAPVASAETGATQRLEITREIALDPAMVTSAFTLPGFQVGIVRGLIVRSASFGGQVVAAFQSLGGGNIRPMTKVCEHARTDAFLMTLEHAAQLGANAIIGFGYDTTEIATGMTEVLAYGTAVIVEPVGAAAARADGTA